MSSDDYIGNKYNSQNQEVIDLSQCEEDKISAGDRDSLVSSNLDVNVDHGDISIFNDTDVSLSPFPVPLFLPPFPPPLNTTQQVLKN